MKGQEGRDTECARPLETTCWPHGSFRWLWNTWNSTFPVTWPDGVIIIQLCSAEAEALRSAALRLKHSHDNHSSKRGALSQETECTVKIDK